MDEPGAPANVVFVVLDTVRKDRLTVYGHDRETTPGLERFAEEAAVFEQAVAPAPWTLPVHASLFTGLYPGEHGATQEKPYLEGATTLAESLGAHESACYSSNAWITPYTHLTDGFDRQDNFFEVMPGDVLSGPLARAWKTLNDHDRLRGVADRLVSAGNAIHERLASGSGADSKTPAVIDRTIEFVENSSEPYFAFVNLMDAHLPYHPPKEYGERFARGIDPDRVCQNSKAYNSGARSIGEREWRAIEGLYDAEIAHADHEVARLFDWLRENDEWEDSLVIVCADHGELHGEHGLYGHEFGVYDPIVNVPLLVKHPDLDTGRYHRQVELIDLYHTMLDHAGVDPEEGISLDPDRSLLSGAESGEVEDVHAEGGREESATSHGDTAFVEYSRPVVELRQLESKAETAGIDLPKDSRYYSRMRAARRPEGKYIRNERITDETYRLDADPGETENLIGAGDPVIEDLEAALVDFETRVGAWESAAGEDVLEGMDEDARDRLEDLGYID